MLSPSFYSVNLFLHILAVSLWLGITFGFSIFMIPMLRNLPDSRAEEQLKWIGQRARTMVVTLTLVLLGTGLVNVHRVGLLNFSDGWATNYGITAGIKITLAMGLFLAFPVIMIFAHRNGPDELDVRLRRMDRLHWGITAVTIIIMFLGVMLRT